MAKMSTHFYLETWHIFCKKLYEAFYIKQYRFISKTLFITRWSARKVKIENTLGFLKTKFQILCNMNVDLKYASTIVKACYILFNFLIKVKNNGEDENDEEPNYLIPFKLQFDEKKKMS